MRARAFAVTLLVSLLAGCADWPRIGVRITNAPSIQDCFPGSATSPCQWALELALLEPQSVSDVGHAPDAAGHHRCFVYVLLSTGEAAQLNDAIDGPHVDLRGFQREFAGERRFDPGGDDAVIDAFPERLHLSRNGAATRGAKQQQRANETRKKFACVHCVILIRREDTACPGNRDLLSSLNSR